ncbi:TRAP transporter substrate-binding protein DctP [Alcaligenaceae bacterium]|nr:TRAP transporter substrate-binding protein DctP [Alcaligenaceae bacterium]
MKVKHLARVVPLALIALGASSGVVAKEKLRVADSLPAGHYFSEYATKYWMEEVTKATNGEVTFEYYPAEQLGKAKDMLALTQSGVADVGYVVPSYISDKMPLSSVAELPGSFADACSATLAYLKLAQGDGILAQKEFAPNGVRLMFALVVPPYQAFSAKKPLESISDLKGLKIRTAGAAMEATVRSFGGVPVRMAAPELYESLSRGTLDGMLFPYASMISYDLPVITKYGTTGENFGSAALTYIISEARWKKLSPDVQKAMAEAGVKATQRACRMTDEETESNIEKLRSKGVKLVTFSGDDRQAIDKSRADVSKQWAKALDERGKPGTEVLKSFEAALANK